MTEWFDMDEPCLYGDIEDVLQNLAYVNTYTESSAFRICPKSMRTKVEFQTIFGQPAESMSSQIIGNYYMMMIDNTNLLLFLNRRSGCYEGKTCLLE